jgi:hypothetical protein
LNAARIGKLDVKAKRNTIKRDKIVEMRKDFQAM